MNTSLIARLAFGAWTGVMSAVAAASASKEWRQHEEDIRRERRRKQIEEGMKRFIH